MARRTMHIGGTENRFSVPPSDPSIPGGSTPRERFATLLTDLRAAEVTRGDAQFWTPGSAARREIVDAVAVVAHAAGYRGEKPKKKGSSSRRSKIHEGRRSQAR